VDPAGIPDPEPFDELLKAMDSQGRDFERLCAWFLQSDPEYAAEFEQVWLWEDWPSNWGRDKGIDLIARTNDGRIVAIQAKHYSAAYPIKKTDVDSFLAESSRDSIDERLLVATTDLLGPNAREVIDGQSKPVSLCLLSRLRGALVSWPTSLGELTADAPLVLEPRPHQQKALDAIAEWSRGDIDRGQVLMACGTGKTLVAVRAADLVNAETVLVLVPTLPLLRQTAGVWAGQSTMSRRTIRVCSDRTDSDSEQVTKTNELGFPTTTDPAAVAEFLRAEGPRIVFATYNSSPAIADAMAAAPEVCFDLVVADEAHRCAGAAKKPTKTVLDAEKIRATRRLFFTATPTLFGPKDKQRARNVNVTLASMDDLELFGPVVYHLSFADAVEQELLCPYQVAVIPITDDEVQALIDHRRLVTADGTHIFEAAALATQIACARAMRKYKARRIVAFHPRIEDSRRFAEHFPVAASLLPEHDQPTSTVWSEHVDGRWMPRGKRTRLLREFEQPSGDFRLLSNVRLLTEGVDVPAIDGIAFVDTHRGSVSVIQAVGRAMRLAEGKTAGTIILPIIVRQGEDIGTALARREHRAIVEILGALRSHDPEIFRSLDDLRFTANSGEETEAPRRFVIDAPVDVDEAFADAVDVALTKALGTNTVRSPRRRAQPVLLPAESPLSDEEVFDRGLEMLRRYARWSLAPAVPERPFGFPLGAWWEEIKNRWRAGTLDPDLKWPLADAVSWLAPGLGSQESIIRGELRALTTYSVPEQLDTQLSRQGIHTTGPLAGLAGEGRDFFDDDGLLERLDAVHASVTHAAMSRQMQLLYLVATVRPLAEVLATTRADEDSFHHWERAAILYGYTDRLQEDEDLVPHWWSRSDPQSYMAGYNAAGAVMRLVRRMALYRFDGDVAEVDRLRSDDARHSPDARLDALGWDIYLLARHQNFPHSQAIRLAQGNKLNTLKTRQAMRTQLLGRQRAALRPQVDRGPRAG
jgi:superfamily II DNA or RNA helicase